MHQVSSPCFNKAVEELASLPGIGNKTAVRLVLRLLNREEEEIKNFGQAFLNLAQQIQYCIAGKRRESLANLENHQ